MADIDVGDVSKTHPKGVAGHHLEHGVAATEHVDLATNLEAK